MGDMEQEIASDEPIKLDDLRNLVGELRMMARGLLAAESGAHSLTPTALAMTALRRAKLKETDWEDVRWENRAHFFSALARAMRNALTDHARRRKARGREQVLYFDPEDIFSGDLPAEAQDRPERVILVEEALALLDAADKRLADVIDQYYYAGYTVPEMARFTGVSEKTVDRDLKRARVLLRKIVEDLSKAA
jgi:RNA polymerase sigma factor (TIGR02999 family)